MTTTNANNLYNRYYRTRSGELEQLAQNYQTSTEVMQAITEHVDACFGEGEIRRLWQDPTGAEIEAIERRAFELVPDDFDPDQDELWWGDTRIERPATTTTIYRVYISNLCGNPIMHTETTDESESRKAVRELRKTEHVVFCERETEGYAPYRMEW